MILVERWDCCWFFKIIQPQAVAPAIGVIFKSFAAEKDMPWILGVFLNASICLGSCFLSRHAALLFAL